ncbi:hypothetical protein COLSTE_01783 [Collinsella stercoris DSM 13279]|uniref:Uncharacterized protein n=1 Tax=Collinsella stercoris DSM 13279 TaxID=445975 RepID=B6GCG0_9ACTN|nr:hypothetical protein COLSTE_01783 [Collinsella stercoris DSM 13279]
MWKACRNSRRGARASARFSISQLRDHLWSEGCQRTLQSHAHRAALFS